MRPPKTNIDPESHWLVEEDTPQVFVFGRIPFLLLPWARPCHDQSDMADEAGAEGPRCSSVQMQCCRIGGLQAGSLAGGEKT